MQQFSLTVEPRDNMTYALAVQQRYTAIGAQGRGRLHQTSMISGLHLVSSWDLVLEMLRDSKIHPKVLHRERKTPVPLSEPSGVRLSLLFKTIAPLTRLDHIRAVQQALWAMSDEEIYYWFSKCSGARKQCALRALRILCGDVE